MHNVSFNVLKIMYSTFMRFVTMYIIGNIKVMVSDWDFV